MAAQPALPLLAPTVPGCVEGIICREPFTLQCQECGAVATAETVGVAPGKVAAVVILSHFHFHPRPWSGGQTDNPRLCRDCRQARQCTCEGCRWERGQR